MPALQPPPHAPCWARCTFTLLLPVPLFIVVLSPDKQSASTACCAAFVTICGLCTMWGRPLPLAAVKSVLSKGRNGGTPK